MLKYGLSLLLISGSLLMQSFSIYASDIEDNKESSLNRKRKWEESEENSSYSFPYKKYKTDQHLTFHNNEADTIGFSPVITPKETTIDLIYEQQFPFCTIGLPREIMFHILTFLPVPDIARMSQVSKNLNMLSDDPQLWKEVKQSIYGDYLENEATKENAKLHWLRVIVNTMTDIEKIEFLVRKYKLNINYHLPYFDIEHQFIKHLTNLRPIIEEKVAQGNEEFIQLKVEGLRWGHYGYEKDRMAALTFINQLINQGNGIAIWMMNYLWRGGFINDENGGPSFHKGHIVEGELAAHEHKMNSMIEKLNEDKQNFQAVMEFNEKLVKEGNEAAIRTKIKALLNGIYGYEYNPQDAAMFNDNLIAQGNKRAIERKLEGLKQGTNGYQRDYNAFITFKDQLQLTHPEALGRYIEEFLDEGDYQGFMQINEPLVEQGNEEAILRKIELLSGYHHDSLNNYECYNNPCEVCEPWQHTGGIDRAALELLIDRFVEKGSKVAIQSKILFFIKEVYGYRQPNPFKLKNWLEEEESRGKRWAYYLKAQGLKYGILGFEKDLGTATTYINKYGIPFYLKNLFKS